MGKCTKLTGCCDYSHINRSELDQITHHSDSTNRQNHQERDSLKSVLTFTEILKRYFQM